ncbi:unnamed protein product, partial [Phaeothamnion confervicola]
PFYKGDNTSSLCARRRQSYTMQTPPEMRWSKPDCMGEPPTKRSGHSFTVVGTTGYLFGGCPQRKPPGPTDELFKLDMSNPAEFYWQKVPPSGRGPKARWHHSAAVHNRSTLIIFGGFQSSGARFNDVWFLDVHGDKWSQPQAGVTEESPEGAVAFKKPWRGCPVPRGGHSGNVVGNSLVVFGGYGGPGFSRRDFNDLHVLDLDAMEWAEVEGAGSVPEPRSGHQTVVVGQSLYLCGGWNSVQQFDDLYVLDTSSWTWSRCDGGCGSNFGPPRWNHSAVGVFAVPHWKVFVFGGNSGDLQDSGNPQGDYLSDLCVLDTGSNTWSRPAVVGEGPAPRSDSPLIYDAENSRLLLFGGWANGWFGELHVCSVGEVVGPPYSLESAQPASGPTTGGTAVTVDGMGFTSVKGAVTVRLACPKGFLEVAGDVVSDRQLSFHTPSFEKFGAVTVQCRVAIGAKALTASCVGFQYFSVADATKTLAFGPGLLSGFAPGMPVVFVIQSKDKNGNDRICGADEFRVTVVPADGAGISGSSGAAPVANPAGAAAGANAMPAKRPSNGGGGGGGGPVARVDDHNDGTYTVTYMAPRAGSYLVSVEFLGTFNGVAGHIRGSPFRARAVDGADREGNTLGGPLLVAHIRESTKELKDDSSRVVKGLRKIIPSDDRSELIKVKEFVRGVTAREGELSLRVDGHRAALAHMRRRNGDKGGGSGGGGSALEGAAAAWREAQQQAPLTEASIVPLTRTWSQRTHDEMEAYEAAVKRDVDAFKKLPFWAFQVRPAGGRKALAAAEAELERQKKLLDGHRHVCAVFDFPGVIEPSAQMIAKMEADCKCMYQLWDVCEALQAFVTGGKELLWAEVKPDVLEDEAKAQMKAVKALHRDVRWCDAFKAVDKTCKDFLNTIPLISLLGSKAMRPRHWAALQKVTGKEFVPPHEDPQLKLGGLLALELHQFGGDVEEIADQAAKEEKMEATLLQLAERWAAVIWLTDPYNGGEVTLLKIAEEDFEALENDQLVVQ